MSYTQVMENPERVDNLKGKLSTVFGIIHQLKLGHLHAKDFGRANCRQNVLFYMMTTKAMHELAALLALVLQQTDGIFEPFDLEREGIFLRGDMHKGNKHWLSNHVFCFFAYEKVVEGEYVGYIYRDWDKMDIYVPEDKYIKFPAVGVDGNPMQFVRTIDFASCRKDGETIVNQAVQDVRKQTTAKPASIEDYMDMMKMYVDKRNTVYTSNYISYETI